MDIKKLARKNILRLKSYTSARQSHLEGVLLDANENALGSVIKDVYSLDLNRYPDPNQNDIRQILSGHLKINKNNLFFGVGSDEIIDLLIRIFCEPSKDKVMILQPTYGMYKVACDINNAETINVDLDDSFQIDFNNIEQNISEEVKLIFLCSPNNPTGNLLNSQDVLKLAKLYNAIIVVDEAYVDFSEPCSLINEVQNHPNLVILRTFSKAWGLAGIRCGYCVAYEDVIDLLMKVKAPYNINKFIFQAVKEAISNEKLKREFVEKILNERERVKVILETLNGVEKVFHSDANFLLFKCKDSKNVLKKLADKGIIIRERSGHKYLENCLRVTIGTKEENDLFLNELREIL